MPLMDNYSNVLKTIYMKQHSYCVSKSSVHPGQHVARPAQENASRYAYLMHVFPLTARMRR